MQIIILMGSPNDDPIARKAIETIESFEIPWRLHIASAHKSPRRLLDLLAEYEADPQPKVYLTIAGRSNALSGMVDAQVSTPVIACPPSSSSFSGADVFSSLRMPSGVAPVVVLDPHNAALAAVKMLALAEPALKTAVTQSQAAQRQRLVEADAAHRE